MLHRTDPDSPHPSHNFLPAGNRQRFDVAFVSGVTTFILDRLMQACSPDNEKRKDP
jgi:hypothetical protein